jgi:DNA mismatch repair protein MutL
MIEKLPPCVPVAVRNTSVVGLRLPRKLSRLWRYWVFGLGNECRISTMLRRVALLDPHTINQIAAGEVVERPASVVKELVENALDAGAKRIEVTVEEAGRKRIRVSDNGCGMGPEDAEAALERHATSKIRSAGDLHRVTSLGFRGEALPSIASVSRMTLSTAEEDGARHRVCIEFGKIVSRDSVPGPAGTEITVEDLFANTPARLKFLKSDTTEASQITEVIGKYATAYPDVAFTLRFGDHAAIASSGSGSLTEAIGHVWGADLARALAEVDTVVSGIRVQGFVAPPHVNKPGRSHQVFFVNGRPVRSKTLYASADAAYRSLTPERRYAVVALSLSLDPADIDINISPTKSEVKFHREGAAFDAVRLAIKGGLMDHGLMPSAATGFQFQSVEGGAAVAVAAPAEVVTDLFRESYAPQPEETARYPFLDLLDDLKVLGQVMNTFIVVSTRKGIAIIDQHVAHERVLYEYLCGLRGGGAIEAQPLLSPETIEFERSEAVALSERLEDLRGVGFQLEPFGPLSFLIRTVPAAAANKDYRKTLQDVAAELLNTDGRVRPESAREKIWITTACRMAVKAGDPLSIPEMEKLIRDLAETENPYLCPHGRPITITLTSDELLRKFKRT